VATLGSGDVSLQLPIFEIEFIGQNKFLSGLAPDVRARGTLLMIFIICLLEVQVAFTQEVNWVVVEGKAGKIASNLEKTRRQAIENADKKAVAKALVPGISVEALLVNLRLRGSLLGGIPYGVVVSREILKEGPVQSADNSESFYRVWMRAAVIQKIGGEDSSFDLDATLNQSVFKDGDEMKIQIRSTQSCHLSVYNILEGEKIIQLLPNSLSDQTFLKAFEVYTFPSKDDRKKGLRLKVHLPKNKKAVTESIYILALPYPFKLRPSDIPEGIFGVFDGQTAFMKDLIGEVVNIPSGSRAEALIQYDIYK
jgi:hypothetical protein